MKIKNIRNIIIQGVLLNISKYDFKLNKREVNFERFQNGFLQVFTLLFTKNMEGIFVEPILQLKSHQIEKIYHSFSKKESKYYSGTVTLGNNMFSIIDFIESNIDTDTDTKQRYLIEEERDLDILIKVISEKFEKYGLHYFDQNSYIFKVDELLNKHPKEISIHNWLYPVRACIAIIAAKLNNNPHLNELIEIYDMELHDAVEPYKTEFNNIKKFLMGS